MRRFGLCVLALHAATLTLGCGKVPLATDSGVDPSDAEEDADAPPPAKGPVTVTYFYANTPVPDANIVIHDPSGAVFAEATTELNGTRRFEDVPRGSMLTVGKSLGNAPRVYTVIGLEANDNLVLGDRIPQLTAGTITVTASGITAAHYSVGAGCDIASNWNGATRTISANSNCSVTSSTFHVVAIAYNASNQPIAYAVATNVGSGGSVTLSTWSTDWGTFAIDWSNRPAATSTTAAYLGFGWPLPDQPPAPSTAASGTVSVRYPKNVISSLDYSVHASGTGTISMLNRRIAAMPSVTLDLSQQMLPPLVDVATGLNDRARPNFFWSTPTPATGADRLAIDATWDGPGYYEWHVYAPADLPSPYQLPAIPASWGAAMTPPTASGWTFNSYINLSDDESKANWNAVRGEPGKYIPNRSTYATTNASF